MSIFRHRVHISYGVPRFISHPGFPVPVKKKTFFGTTWDHMFRPLGPWTWLSETMTIIFTIWQAASEPPVSRFAEGVAQITIEAGGFQPMAEVEDHSWPPWLKLPCNLTMAHNNQGITKKSEVKREERRIVRVKKNIATTDGLSNLDRLKSC